MRNSILRWLLLGGFNITIPTLVFSQPNYTASIVRIYGYRDIKIMGTGSFYSFNGNNYILTCYHNLSGCSRFEGYSNVIGTIDNIKIVAYDDTRDIMLLSYSLSKGFEPKNLTGGPIPTNLSSIDGITIGHPNGTTEQKMRVGFTADNGVISTKGILDHGKAVFKLSAEFNVIPIDLTIYSGMSGAPVIVNSKVIGIVSGSFNEGGSIAWAIPISYCEQLHFLPTPLSSAADLPGLQCFTADHMAMTRDVILDETLTSTIYTPINDVVEEIQSKSAQIISSKITLNKHVAAALKFIDETDFSEPNIGFQSTTPEATRADSFIYAIRNEYDYVTSVEQQMADDINSFSTLVSQLEEYKPDLKLDEAVGQSFQSRSDPLDFQIREVLVKQQNKASQKFTAGQTCDLYKIMNKGTYKTYCRDYFVLLMDEDNYDIEKIKLGMERLKLLKAQVDLLYEAKGFSDN